MQPNNYLFIVTDSETIEGLVFPARKILEYRLNNSIWGLYAGTACTSIIKKGDKLLFYVAGKKRDAQVIAAEAIVDNIRNYHDEDESKYYDVNTYYSDIPQKILELKEIKKFNNPIYLKPLVGELSFMNKKTNKWGIYMQGGVKRVTNKDIERIFQKEV